LARGIELPEERSSIYQLTRRILAALGVPPPPDMD
jgi:hypothetical protein